MITEKECAHIAEVLTDANRALAHKDYLALKSLSNKTIHSACKVQDSASITIAVILYALSKVIERHDYARIRSWETLVKKLSGTLSLAAEAVRKNQWDAYKKHVEKARKTLESQSVKIKPYIADVLRKAAINKGSRMYEHGISLEQTAKLLGLSQWELSEYIGQKSAQDAHHETINVKQRAKMALEFFS